MIKLKKRKNILVVIAALVIVLLSVLVIASKYAVNIILLSHRPDGGGNEINCENQVSILSSDGFDLISQIEYSETDSNKWVILVHGYHGSGDSLKWYGQKYLSEGFNILIPDNRAHGKSSGDYIGMGYLEQFDILLWVEYIININPDAQIVLHGFSMGGAAVMLTASNPSLPDNVMAVIEDSSYASAMDYFAYRIDSELDLPVFPTLNIASLGSALFAGYFLESASPVDRISNCQIPTLFIHGTDDDKVPLENVYSLYEEANCYKELYIVEGANHLESASKHDKQYWMNVFTFISTVMNVNT